MTEISFTQQMYSPGLDGLALPVEIRRSTMSLVTRCTTADRIALWRGSYVAIVRLPSGHRLSVDFDVPGTSVVNLSPDVEDQSPRETLARYHYFSRNVRLPVGEVRWSRDAQIPPLGLRWCEGVIWSPNLVLRNESPRVPAPYEEIEVRPQEGATQSLDILRYDEVIRRIALPASAQSSCFVSFVETKKARLGVSVRVGHPEANLIVAFLQHQQACEAEVMLGVGSMAEDLLLRKRADPIAAAIGAYAILRLNELERLHNWTENLYRWFPWLPDGAAIRGEHLAGGQSR